MKKEHDGVWYAMVTVFLIELVIAFAIAFSMARMYRDAPEPDYVLVSEYDGVDICYHKDTGVMYSISHRGDVTVMVDANGNPLIYDKYNAKENE